MAPKSRVIIDTDPGCDDVLALLLALSASSEEMEVLLVSITHGNVDAQACLRNAVATFHVLEEEVVWRKQQKLPVGFEGITKYRPIVAVGAEEPLHDVFETADYFHGRDGLAGSSETHPHFGPKGSWMQLFEKSSEDYISKAAEGDKDDLSRSKEIHTKSFTPSLEPSHREVLRLLRENEPDTITLVALGPLTNFALAAAEDPETFLRAKELVTMGGAVDCFGNVTPVAEFNVFADPVAAARVYALSSKLPASTMPPITRTSTGRDLPAYKEDTTFSKQLRIILMSLDITEYHALNRKDFNAYTQPLAKRGSPLAQWLDAFMTPMLDKMEQLHLGHEGEGAALSLHDPLTIWYLLTKDRNGWAASEKSPEDIRVETTGEWSRGMTVGDRRLRRRRNSDGVRPHDRGNWLGNKSGNRIYRMLDSPGRDLAGPELMQRLLGEKSDERQEEVSEKEERREVEDKRGPRGEQTVEQVDEKRDVEEHRREDPREDPREDRREDRRDDREDDRREDRREVSRGDEREDSRKERPQKGRGSEDADKERERHETKEDEENEREKRSEGNDEPRKTEEEHASKQSTVEDADEAEQHSDK